ncbi:hypothetical protein EDB87DRAFT_1565954 [Lactarius vividus]|nr:hypothetical protein EDB87DRAFT_1565954 [Lactarius vividus]
MEFAPESEFDPSPHFNSVSGLLRQWPNALRRNGHSLVPATIPKGTILYHGRADPRIPSPDWVAFDFEHSYLLCLESCYVISLQAKRDLRLVYFDGLSAGKRKDGTLDSQDVILWGRPRPDKYYSEVERIEGLCDWGRPLGLDGFVRMEFAFEAMICDFLDAAEVVSLLDVIPPNQTTIPERLPGMPFPLPQPGPPNLPSGWHGSPPDMRRNVFEAYISGTWHDRAPGETRVRPDYSGLVTFYDPSLSSLVEARHGKDRSRIRLDGISALDSERVRAELQTVLMREPGGVGGVDWGSIVRVVIERYAGRLEYLRSLLSPSTSFADPLERAAMARAQLLVMLVPYITTADVPKQLPASADLSWAAPIARRCATTQTSLIPLGMLTPQEARIHAAVENTLHEICRRLVLVWVEFFDVEAADEAGATGAIEMARGHIFELMAWLDWSEWVRCEPGCSLGEFCYIPSWPYFEEDDPNDLTPRCRSFEGFARRPGVSHAGN